MRGRQWPSRLSDYRNQQKLDVEKHLYERADTDDDEYDDDPSYSDPSSRVTSDSYQPMLGRSSRSTSHHHKSIYAYRLPSRLTRYLCLVLFSTLIIFIFTLVRMSWASAKKVEDGVANPKPPSTPQWESFEFLKRYYGGIRTLTTKSQSLPEYPWSTSEEQSGDSSNATAEMQYTTHNVTRSSIFNPYPEYTSASYLSQHMPVQKCYLDDKNTIEVPMLHHYEGVVEGFPEAVIGSNKVIGVRDDICFDRFGRLGPYGLGYSLKMGGSGASLNGDREGADEVWKKLPEVDYGKIRWARAQDRCLSANSKRFAKPATDGDEDTHPMDKDMDIRRANNPHPEFVSANITRSQDSATGKTLLSRTAVIIRTWWDYDYKIEDIMYLRALISELSLLSGGEYTLHFLIHVKDDNLPIWSDTETYERVLRDSLPEEFRGMGTLWTEREMGLMYGGLEETFYRDLPVHGVYRSSFMPLMYFARRHPEYEYFWNWEMDARYTGNWYSLFESVRQWTKSQPRKGLWERNGRFYIPSIHGSWDEFKQRIKFQTEEGTNTPNNMWSHIKNTPGNKPDQVAGDKPIWGPDPPMNQTYDDTGDISPPTSEEKDSYTWGVGEEADLITFNPLFDPAGTTWLLADDVTGYDTSKPVPRRTAIITASRLSRRLLNTMHRETALYRHSMFSEMWPASMCLHHGFKAVYAPHPVYIDRNWPVPYLAAIFNGGRNGASGGARTSVFGDREHNFRGTTWYYNAGFSPNLWKRWLGYRVDGNGGEEEELANEGRMCLPPMLLHPIKEVNMVQEGLRDP
ncbi:MAG: hypothetical protein M1834_008114 [Cirrosporium novae-zelandiae]|nr:MAG: hypothetical protein M1834_008114 [Cirrosporium novae-zelandiae]